MQRRQSIDGVLAGARESFEQLAPEDAYRAAQNGAVLVDIRSVDEQARQAAVIPGAVHHPLAVLLWRLDPDVPTHNPKLPLDARVILICREGYCSSLAAAQVREIGFEHATDVIGGVAGWVAAGLPTEPWH